MVLRALLQTARFRKFCFGSLKHKLMQKDMSLETISVFHEGLDKALERLGKQNIRLKECQYEAVKAIVIEKKDTLCVLPTGYGKSLIYQLLPTVFDVHLDCEDSSSVIVISPLNALMVDQIAKLKEHMDVSVFSPRKASKFRSAKKCRPKSNLGRHVSAFFKICFHVLEH